MIAAKGIYQGMAAKSPTRIVDVTRVRRSMAAESERQKKEHGEGEKFIKRRHLGGSSSANQFKKLGVTSLIYITMA